MGWYEWLLFLHVLAAFAMVGATAAFWTVMIAGRRSDDPVALMRALPSANIAIGAGSIAAIVFGVWLTFYIEGYAIWDAWILASLVLWAVSVETGRRGGKEIDQAAKRGADALRETLRARGTNAMLGASTLALLVILVLMIWKPGAA